MLQFKITIQVGFLLGRQNTILFLSDQFGHARTSLLGRGPICHVGRIMAFRDELDNFFVYACHWTDYTRLRLANPTSQFVLFTPPSRSPTPPPPAHRCSKSS